MVAMTSKFSSHYWYLCFACPLAAEAETIVSAFSAWVDPEGDLSHFEDVSIYWLILLLSDCLKTLHVCTS